MKFQLAFGFGLLIAASSAHSHDSVYHAEEPSFINRDEPKPMGALGSEDPDTRFMAIGIYEEVKRLCSADLDRLCQDFSTEKESDESPDAELVEDVGYERDIEAKEFLTSSSSSDETRMGMYEHTTEREMTKSMLLYNLPFEREKNLCLLNEEVLDDVSHECFEIMDTARGMERDEVYDQLQVHDDLYSYIDDDSPNYSYNNYFWDDLLFGYVFPNLFFAGFLFLLHLALKHLKKMIVHAKFMSRVFEAIYSNPELKSKTEEAMDGESLGDSVPMRFGKIMTTMMNFFEKIHFIYFVLGLFFVLVVWPVTLSVLFVGFACIGFNSLLNKMGKNLEKDTTEKGVYEGVPAQDA